MIFTNVEFEGHWPVGTSAVVRAKNQQEAAKKLSKKLEEWGLPQEIDPKDMLPFKRNEDVVILDDGDY